MKLLPLSSPLLIFVQIQSLALFAGAIPSPAQGQNSEDGLSYNMYVGSFCLYQLLKKKKDEILSGEEKNHDFYNQTQIIEEYARGKLNDFLEKQTATKKEKEELLENYTSRFMASIKDEGYIASCQKATKLVIDYYFKENKIDQTSSAGGESGNLQSTGNSTCIQEDGKRICGEINESGETCIENAEFGQICIAKKGVDVYGLPKPPKWAYWMTPEGALTYEPVTPYKVNVRGNTNRYIEIKRIVRKYSSGSMGTPSSRVSFGNTNTSCSSLGTNIYTTTLNCTTTGPSVINIPGRAPELPGIKQLSVSAIVDCKDETFELYVNNAKVHGWKKLKRSDFIYNKLDACKEDIEGFPLSKVRRYID